MFDIVFGVCSMESKATFSSGKIESVFRPVPNIARLMGAILLGSNRIPLHLINNLKTFETNGYLFHIGNSKRYEKVDFKNYYLDNPFQESCSALYHWSPIADELKILDKEIVLNSMRLKWNLVDDEFKKLTKNLNFN